MDYYSRKLFLPQVNHKDQIIGKVERWQAHEKGTLHRGFTVILTYDNQLILQHRKHPAFNGLYDLTFSSHPIYFEDDRLQDNLAAIYDSLRREWGIEKKNLNHEPKFLDKFYYKAKDPKSLYTEHEIDYLYLAELNKLPKPNPDFAYGFELVDSEPFSSLKFQISNFPLAPWVPKIIASKSFREL